MGITDYVKFSGFAADMKSRNFSVYGQWLGIILVFLSIGLGISNLFHVSALIAFGIIAIVQGVIIGFVEVPFLLKIFRVPDTFISFVQLLDTNWWRAAFYVVNALLQWLSLSVDACSLLALAALYTVNAVFYALAAVTKQEFHKSNVVATVAVTDLPVDAQIRSAL